MRLALVIVPNNHSLITMSAIDRWKQKLETYRRSKGSESTSTLTERMVRTAFEAGFVGDAFRAKWTGLPKLTSLAIKKGLNVGTMYGLYAAIHPERLAIVDAEQQLTYAEAEEEILRLVQGLSQRLGVTRRTPVVLMMQNRSEYLLLWMALIRLGALVVHGSWRQSEEELIYLLDHSGARILCADASAAEVIESVAATRQGGLLQLVGIGVDLGGWTYDALLNAGPGRGEASMGKTEQREDENKGGSIVYTSGTTGRPKGALRDFTTFGLIELFRILDRLPVEAGDRHLIVTPLYHSAAQAFFLIQAALGATLYLEKHFDPERTLELLSTQHIHSVFMVPTMIRRILELPEGIHEALPTPCLRALLSGAAPFPQALREQAIARFGATVVHDFYGATEIGWITLITGQEMLDHPRSVGRPLPGQEVLILDEQGRPLPPKDTGLIYVRNAQTMAGYHKDEEATRATMCKGAMSVDDLGYLDEQGYLYVVGRARDLVISGGVNIYPAQIEEVIAQHEDVTDVAVIGVPDEVYGEALVAIVCTSKELDPAELKAHTRNHLPGYKVPRRWHFVDALPRNPTGKVLKGQLVETYGS